MADQLCRVCKRPRGEHARETGWAMGGTSYSGHTFAPAPPEAKRCPHGRSYCEDPDCPEHGAKRPEPCKGCRGLTEHARDCPELRAKREPESEAMPEGAFFELDPEDECPTCHKSLRGHWRGRPCLETPKPEPEALLGEKYSSGETPCIGDTIEMKDGKRHVVTRFGDPNSFPVRFYSEKKRSDDGNGAFPSGCKLIARANPVPQSEPELSDDAQRLAYLRKAVAAGEIAARELSQWTPGTCSACRDKTFAGICAGCSKIPGKCACPYVRPKPEPEAGQELPAWPCPCGCVPPFKLADLLALIPKLTPEQQSELARAFNGEALLSALCARPEPERACLLAEFRWDDSGGKYFTKARVYGAISARFYAALKELATNPIAQGALAWRSDSCVPQGALEDFERLMRAESERDTANARAEVAERSMRDAANANVMALHKNDALKEAYERTREQLTAANASLKAATERAERAEQEASAANETLRLCRENCDELVLLRPVVDAARNVQQQVELGNIPSDGHSGRAFALSDLEIALRALDSSAPVEVATEPQTESEVELIKEHLQEFDDDMRHGDASSSVSDVVAAVVGERNELQRNLTAAEKRYMEAEDERDELREKLAEAEKRNGQWQLDALEAQGADEDRERLINRLRAELATVVERTARAQRAACADAYVAASRPHKPWFWALDHIKKTLLVTPASLPPEPPELRDAVSAANPVTAPAGSVAPDVEETGHRCRHCKYAEDHPMHWTTDASPWPSRAHIFEPAPRPSEEVHPSARAPIDFSKVGSVRGIREPKPWDESMRRHGSGPLLEEPHPRGFDIDAEERGAPEPKAEAMDEWTDRLCDQELAAGSDAVDAIKAIKRRNARIAELERDLGQEAAADLELKEKLADAERRASEAAEKLADPKVPPVFQERIDAANNENERLRAKCSRQRKELRRFNRKQWIIAENWISLAGSLSDAQQQVRELTAELAELRGREE